MAGKATHTIRKQVIRLGLDSREKALNRQEAVRDLYYNRLLPRLEKLFDSYDIPGITIRLDKLHLDLGHLRLDELEHAFVEQACKAMEAELIKQLKGNSLLTGKAELVEAEETCAELVHVFLKTGRLPWWAGLQNLTPALALETLLEQKPALALEILAVARGSQSERQRLAWQFPPVLLRKLIELLAGASPRAVATHLLEALESIRPTEMPKWQSFVREALILALLEAPAAFAGHAVDAPMGGISPPTRPVPQTTTPPEQGLALQPTAAAVEVFRRTVVHLARIGHRSPTAVLQAMAQAVAKRKKRGQLPEPVALLQKLLRALDVEELTLPPRLPDAMQHIPADSKPAESTSSTPSWKPSKAATSSLDDETYIQNAGIVILVVFLQPLFTQLGLVAEGAFVSEEAQAHALTVLHYLAYGEGEPAEEAQVLDKLLCGWPEGAPVPPPVPLGKSEMEEVESIMASVIEHWAVLGHIDSDGLRTAFLQREGKLKQVSNGWSLHVNRLGYDIMVDRLPWSISVATLPWMKAPVFVNW